MKKMIAATVVFGLIGMIGIGNAWAGRISDRQGNQRHRIAQGLGSGELTRVETRILVKEQRRIRRTIARAWSDGRLTTKERVKIERRQDNASRHIYRLKHNVKDRN